LAAALQIFPHSPQLFSSVAPSTVHPLAALQVSSVPVHLGRHFPPIQLVPPEPVPVVEHAVVQVPQWFTSVPRLTSQPSLAAVLQFS
jgi:hypothetical protein